MTDKQSRFHSMFIVPIERTGRITLLVATVCLFAPGTYLWLFHGLFPPINALFKALIGIWSFAIVFSIVEPVIYFTLIGFGGTYMSFLTGNLVNLRLPVSITAQQVAGTEEGTPEAEIVSTLGVAGSLIASQLVLTVGVLLFLPLLGRMSASGTPISVALDHVLPSLLGALLGMFVFKDAKLGVIPVGLGIIIAFFFSHIPTSYAIAPMVVISVFSARFMYRKGWLN